MALYDACVSGVLFRVHQYEWRWTGPWANSVLSAVGLLICLCLTAVDMADYRLGVQVGSVHHRFSMALILGVAYLL